MTLVEEVDQIIAVVVLVVLISLNNLIWESFITCYIDGSALKLNLKLFLSQYALLTGWQSKRVLLVRFFIV